MGQTTHVFRSLLPSWHWDTEAACHPLWHIKQPVVLAEACYLSE